MRERLQKKCLTDSVTNRSDDKDNAGKEKPCDDVIRKHDGDVRKHRMMDKYRIIRIIFWNEEEIMGKE